MATTTKSKLKKNDDLTIRQHVWSDYENGIRHRLNHLETVSGYEYHMDDGTWVFVHKTVGNQWVVTDRCTGMKVSDSCSTRKDAMESANRNAEKFAKARETDRYKDACQAFLILAIEGDLTDDELKERIEDWHREIRDRESEERSNMEKLAHDMARIYGILYDWDCAAGDSGVDYTEHVDYGDKWIRDNPERVKMLVEIREDLIASDREVAALGFAIRGEEPELVKVPEPAPVPKQNDSSSTGKFLIGPDGINALKAALEPRNVVFTQKREGCCIWASGDTEPHKEQLKELGFRWSPKRKAWYLKTA